MIKKILKVIGYSLLTVIVSLTLYTFVSTQILGNKYTNVFGYSFFKVKTASMTGTIEVNDFIIVKVTKDVNENEVVSFVDKRGEVVTHRLISKKGNEIITQGDANNTQDDAVKLESVIGKVIFIFSPSFLFKLIAAIFIVIIFLLLINFDKFIKKYLLDEEVIDNNNIRHYDVLPEDVFSSPKKKGEEKSTGLTVSIPMEDIEKMKKSQEEVAYEEELEVIGEEVIDVESNRIVIKENNSRKDREKELIELIVNLLRVKNDSLKTTKINKKWLEKYKYVYTLVNIVNISDNDNLEEQVKHPTFKEIYDYDLDKVGLYDNLRNRLYEMPIYFFLKILCYVILYNDEEFFDGVFKIMKYKILIDKNNNFKSIKKDDSYGKKQLKLLISFMQKIPNNYDNKNVFELDRIERLVKIRGYVSK